MDKADLKIIGIGLALIIIPALIYWKFYMPKKITNHE
jgi:hypothetical protein